ncbi:putative DNA binding domain-containing protein [Myxococcota bacterium]|nr:putative DNA binding domain-containing protein [Myxococcota bacterium]MCZ7617598.1 putative DNA binding domain-containing protein [Myxococcota bacterium]
MKLDEAALRRLMRDDEGERLEFKQSLLSRKEIGEYAVGIGNEGGGWLVMGVTDKKPRQIAGIDEPTPSDLQQIRDSVLDATSIRIECHLIKAIEKVVLAVEVPARPRGQLFQTKAGKFLMRTGDGLRGMPIAEIERIRAEELNPADHSADVIGSDSSTVIDPVEFERLKRILRENGRDELARLPDNDLLRSLGLISRSGRKLQVHRAAAMLLGTADALSEWAPNHEVKLLRFDRDELTPEYSEDSRAPLLAVIQRAEEVIEVANSVESFQQGMFRIDVPKFPTLAYREAVSNALIHRDYERRGNVAVRVYRDRLEVGSPGGWYGGVNESNILVTESQRRNELIAAALQRIGLAERSALGVKRMFREMLQAGKPSPEYRSTATSVTVTLRNGSFDKAFAGLARECAERGEDLTVFDLILLSHLRKHRELTLKEASVASQQTEAEARRILDGIRNRGLAERRGQGRARRYVLGPVAYKHLELTGDRPRDLGISEKTFEGLLIDELGRKREEGLTPREIREWSRYGKAQTTRLLKALCDRGVIVSSGKRGLGARYWLPKYAPRSSRAT